MATDDLPRELPPDTTITVLDSSPHVLDVRLQPGGWRFQHLYFAVFWTSLIVVPMMMLFPPWKVVQPKYWPFMFDRAGWPSSVLAIAMMAVCMPFILWMASILYRQACETTRIHIINGQATITRGGANWREKSTSFDLKDVTIRSGGRKTGIHHIVLIGEKTRLACMNPLSREDAEWLNNALKKRIARRRHGDGHE